MDVSKKLLIYSELKASKVKLGDMTVGSIQKKYLPCGKPNCICHKDKRKLHGPYYFLALQDKYSKKMKFFYISQKKVQKLQQRIKNYKKFKKNIYKMVQLEMELKK